MSGLPELLKFFADLAPAGRGIDWNLAPSKRDFVHLDWSKVAPILPRLDRPVPAVSGAAGPSGGGAFDPPPAQPPTAWSVRGHVKELDRLVSVERMHRAERLLRLGWLFLAGTVEIDGASTKVFVPLVSAPAAVERNAPLHHRVEVESDYSLPRSLLPAAIRFELEEELEELLDVVFAGEAIPELDLRPAGRIATWVTRVAEAMGLPAPAMAPPSRSPFEAGRGLVCYTALGVYTARDVDAPNVAETLRNWASQPLTETALAAVYGVEPLPPESVDEEEAVVSPLPLNRRQQDILQRARSERVTVVSGPPGTGKSHLVAAAAIDEVRLGRSVLIAAQSEHAVDAVHELLERFPGPRFVRFGNRRHRHAVAERLASGLASATSRSRYRELEARFEEAARDQAEALERIVRALERERAFRRALETRDQLAWVVADVPGLAGPLDHERLRRLLDEASSEQALFGRLRRLLARRGLERMLGITAATDPAIVADAVEYAAADDTIRRALAAGGASLVAAFDRLEATTDEVRVRLGELIDAMPRDKRHTATSVALLATALRAGPTARRRTLRSLPGREVLDALPMWLGTLTDIDDSLPMASGMFDVVIFDEASQVNQIRSATALARARRAIVVGDPRQLRHVSFVSDEAMGDAAAEHDLAGPLRGLADVRRNSLFDVAVGAGGIIQMDEHFRSLPHIIGFSDKRFYGGTLRLMTQHPATESLRAIRLLHVDGARRDGVNLAERDRVVELVAEAMAGGETSLGVVSPFRAQADAIEEALLARFGDDEIERVGLRIGTVHGFQGNERDRMILSLALDDDDLARSRRFVEDPHLFNVMVTRARRENVVLHSFDAAALPAGLLRDYLAYALEPPAPFPPGLPAKGWVESLAQRIREYGLRVVADYPVAGHTVDLVVGEGAAAIGVECVVHPDGPAAHVERHMALRRAGWTIVDAFESRWLANPDAAVEAIVEDVLRRAQTRPTPDGGQ